MDDGKAIVEVLQDWSGKTWKRIRIRETGRYLISSTDLPQPINATALDVVDIVASSTPGLFYLAPKSPPIITTEELGPDCILQIEPKCGPVSLVKLLILANATAATAPDQEVIHGIEADVTVLEILA